MLRTVDEVLRIYDIAEVEGGIRANAHVNGGNRNSPIGRDMALFVGAGACDVLSHLRLLLWETGEPGRIMSVLYSSTSGRDGVWIWNMANRPLWRTLWNHFLMQSANPNS